MHYIIETTDQFNRLSLEDSCFIAIITNSDYLHTTLSHPSLIYYRGNNKGLMFIINHSEGESLNFNDIHNFIIKHKKIYCLNSKSIRNFINSNNLIDINFSIISQTGSHYSEYPSNNAYDILYNKFSTNLNINKIVPICKHYERWEKVYDDIKQYIGKEDNTEFLTKYTNLYFNTEIQGIGVLPEIETKNNNFSVFNNKIYTQYNLYNLTRRPTNSFNGINFLALNKEDGSRKLYVPTNDVFIEFDFDSYHLRLISKLIDYEFDLNTSIHQQLGKIYFNKTEELTAEEYDQSKKITFQNIYGGINYKYKDIPFFKKINEYIDKNSQDWLTNKRINLPTGDTIPIDFETNTLKIFNYIIQNLETKYNVLLLSNIQEYLKDKISKICLIVYDSFLIDFSLEDTKNVLYYIKDYLDKQGFPVKVKIGDNYDSLKKIDIY